MALRCSADSGIESEQEEHENGSGGYCNCFQPVEQDLCSPPGAPAVTGVCLYHFPVRDVESQREEWCAQQQEVLPGFTVPEPELGLQYGPQ